MKFNNLRLSTSLLSHKLAVKIEVLKKSYFGKHHLKENLQTDYFYYIPVYFYRQKNKQQKNILQHHKKESYALFLKSKGTLSKENMLR